jgi:hypothetical protein
MWRRHAELFGNDVASGRGARQGEELTLMNRKDAAAIFVERHGEKFVYGLPPQAQPAGWPTRGYYHRPSRRLRWLYRDPDMARKLGAPSAEAEAFNAAQELARELREDSDVSMIMVSATYIRSILAIAAKSLTA